KRQPVWLTSEGGNPNGAQVLFLLDGAEPGDISGFERACLMFDGRDEAALELARSRWKQAKADGIVASYWRESAGGKWEKQA
ncbi:MAG TPA: DNA polymerase III subunit chi, partial [Verrucomicrobiae bacterium]|nr:DNA polymerase III subunit chi [Verrucomicrobiae bacterium]